MIYLTLDKQHKKYDDVIKDIEGAFKEYRPNNMLSVLLSVDGKMALVKTTALPEDYKFPQGIIIKEISGRMSEEEKIEYRSKEWQEPEE